MRIARTATATVVDGPEGRTLELDLLPWNQIARVSDDGRGHYLERWEPGSLIVDDGALLPAYDGHAPTPNGIDHGPLIGRLVPLAGTDTHYRARVDLADTVRAREVHSLAALGFATVSIDAELEPGADPGADGVVTRTAANPAYLRGVAVELPPNRGAYPGAVVTAARSQPGDPAMTLTVTPDPVTPDPDPTPEPLPPTVARADVDEMIRAQIARVRLPQLADAVSPLAGFRRFVDYADAAYGDAELGRAMARAWVDQTTVNNQAVVQPGWLTEVFGIVDAGRPLINAIGTGPLPDSGMAVDWPTFEGDLAALVAEQVAEKTDIASVRVDLTSGSAPIKTYAGGSDISYQLIRRSSPSYRDSYLRIMQAAYALRTDFAASAGILAAITAARGNFVVYDPAAADPTGVGLRTAIFQASVMVQAATGLPASVVIASTDMFVKIGGVLTPAPIYNTTGTATASTLDINVSGLRVAHGVYLPDGTILVTNGQAVSWREDGPMVISAVDVQKLGEDTAIWGMGALTITTPTGVVSLVKVAPVVASSSKG